MSGAPNEPEGGDGPDEDEVFIASLEQRLLKMRTGKAAAIKDVRGALQRIAETGASEQVRKQADDILNRYDLD